MRFISRTSNPQTANGFTLIEVLIISPVVILAISGFVALMVTMTADVLVTRDYNNMTYENQDALDRIEQDVRLSTQFLVTTGNFTAPQGSNNNFTGTAAFTNTSNTLILGSLTTDKNPVDTSRKLIYYAGQPNVCGSQEAYNRVFLAKVIYFIKDGSLWRRSVLPDYNTNAILNDNTVCAAPWQRNTCSPGYSGSTRCQTNDTEVMKNVDSFTTTYFDAPGSTTPLASGQALSATTIEVTLSGKKVTVGRDVISSGTLRATKLNNIDVNLPAPGVPDVSAQVSGNTVTFSWPKVPLASSYLISYNINGGTPTTATLNSQTTSYAVTAAPLSTVTISVTAHNTTGDSSPGTSVATIPPPSWADLPTPTPSPPANWVNYDNGYATKAYTKTEAGIVYLKGLVKNGTVASGTVIFTLPAGYRPSADLTFITSTNGGTEGAPARLDVQTDGDVVIQAIPANTWLSLDTIRFVASGTYTPTNLTLPAAGAWVPWGAPYSSMQSIVDSVGRVHLQGLLKNGVFTDGTVAANLPASGAQRPSHFTTVATTSNTAFNMFSVHYTGSGNVLARGINGSGYWSIQGTHYPYTYGGWTDLPLLAGWVAFNAAAYSPPQYTKAIDGVITLRGLIKNGTASAGTIIAQLPAGYRPSQRLLFTVGSGGAWGRVDILPTGDVMLRQGVTGNLSLDNISFIAEQ